MIIYGGRASKIGEFDIVDCNCNHCEDGKTQNVSVFGKYFHIFWIPIFPIGRKAVAECAECKRTIEQREFSPELKTLYRENKNKVKRPIWHWVGLVLIGVLAALLTINIMTSESDPRGELLRADESLMVANPTMESDSISYKIKQLFDNFIAEEMKPTEFKYLTKIDGEKALILVQIPKLRKVEKESRTQVMELVEMITNNQKALYNKDLFIGIKGVVSMILIKTPNYQDNSRIASTKRLYEFYGPKPPSNK